MAPRSLFDDARARSALNRKALLVLENLANDPNLREHAVRRVERDDPPPYASSTESVNEDAHASFFGRHSTDERKQLL